MLKLFVLRLLRRYGVETMEKSGVHLLEMHSHIHNMSLVLDHRRKDMFFSFSMHISRFFPAVEVLAGNAMMEMDSGNDHRYIDSKAWTAFNAQTRNRRISR
jgi:hypothetical protein